MAITPGPGYMVDPNNPNAVVPIGSTAQAQGLGVYNTGSPAVSTSTPTLTRTSSAPVSSTPTLSSSTPSYTVSTPTLTTTNSNPTATNSSPTSGMTADQLNAYLNDEFDSSAPAQDIMSSYNAQTGAIGSALSSSNTALQNYYSGQSAEQEIQGAANFQAGINASKGLVNPGAMQVIQDQSESLLSTINSQMNDAIASNNTQAATSLANAAATEMTNLVTARQNFLTNYFASETGQQSATQFPATLAQTQAQTGLLGAQTTETQASAASSLASAGLSEAQAAALPAQVQAAITSANAAIVSANAQKTLAGPQAAYQTIVNNMLSGQGSAATISFLAGQLVLNQQNPTQGMSATSVESTLAGIAGGSGSNLLPQVFSQAAANGYNQTGATIATNAANNNAQALSGGGIGSALTATTNFLGGFTSGLSPSIQSSITPSLSTPSGMVQMTGPGGTFNVPSSQISLFKQNGYTEQ